MENPGKQRDERSLQRSSHSNGDQKQKVKMVTYCSEEELVTLEDLKEQLKEAEDQTRGHD